MEEYIRKSFKLKPEVNDMLLQYSEDHGLSQSQCLNFIVRQFLEAEAFKNITLYGKKSNPPY